eukprot:8182530-Heterocapsa_arctica.AAC.1
MMHDEAQGHFAAKAIAASVKKAAEDAARAAAPRRSGSPFGTRPKPKDTPVATQSVDTTDEERSPTEAPMSIAPATPTHPPTEPMAENEGEEGPPVDDNEVAPSDPAPLAEPPW